MDAMKALQSSGARTAGAPLKLYKADARRSGDIRPPQRDSIRVPSALQGLMHMLSNRPGLLSLKVLLDDADSIAGHLRAQRSLAGTWKALADHEHVERGVVVPWLSKRYLPSAITHCGIFERACTGTSR